MDAGKRLATSPAQRRRPWRAHLSLMDVAKLMDAAPGSDELPLALAELEARSPFWRRGMRKLRQLGRDFRSPDLSLTLSEAKGAPALWRELAALAYPEQLVAADSEERFETWGCAASCNAAASRLPAGIRRPRRGWPPWRSASAAG